MPNFRSGTVTAVTSDRAGLQKIEVDGEPAYVLTQLIGPVAVGDAVVINTTAVDLGLGTGGWHFVHWNLSRREWRDKGPGHVMKLRYTSLQTDTGVAEEHLHEMPQGLDRLPVVVCDLHSQMGCVAAAFAEHAPGRRLVYVMTDTAALAIAISDLVAELAGAGLLAATVTSGQAFGGDHEAVNPISALQVALVAANADAVVVAPGPGVVGTGTPLGYGGLEVAAVVDGAGALGATAIIAVRYSDGDERNRHTGMSHHTQTVLQMVARPVLVAVPAGQRHPEVAAPSAHIRAVDVPGLEVLERHGIALATMGRAVAGDLGFFRYAAAAGVLAAQLLNEVA